MRWLPLVLVLFSAASCDASSSPPAVRNALIITLDTTRADALSHAGGPPGVTPALDRLASEGLAYREARTVTPLTLPSHSSMFTGLYPPRHTVRDNNASLPTSAVTLAERASESGFDTAAFVASIALESRGGLRQGFAVYDQPEPPRFQESPQYGERSAELVTARALSWLANRATDGPFLLWVHYFDPHYPYAPPAELAGTAGGNAYLGEVAAVDRAIGSLLERFRAAGALDQTLVVVVGDHGEALGDHGELTHGAFCYDSTLRVPFLLRYPDGWRAGETSTAVVSVADVAPTVAEALGLAPLSDVDGTSLWRRSDDPSRGVYFESLYGRIHYGWSPLVGWLDARGKYVHSSEPQLFDPRTDPGETRDRLGEQPEASRPYRAAIETLLARPPLTSSSSRAELGGARALELAALGYASGPEQAGVHDPLATEDRPAPHRRIDEARRFHAAQAHGVEGRLAEAIAGYESVLAENPLHTSALYELGQAYRNADRCEDAIEPLRRTIALGDDWFGPHFNLASCLARLGRDDEAIESYEQTLALHADLTVAYDELIGLLERRAAAGDAERAQELRALRPLD